MKNLKVILRVLITSIFTILIILRAVPAYSTINTITPKQDVITATNYVLQIEDLVNANNYDIAAAINKLNVSIKAVQKIKNYGVDYITTYNELNDRLEKVKSIIQQKAFSHKPIENQKSTNQLLADKEIVIFQDKNLENVVRNRINKPTGEILVGDVNTIKNLSAVRKNISNLSGIENLANLTFLDLSNNQINNIESINKLSYLTNLTVLSLNNCNIKDLRWINGLTNLTKLSIQNNGITDIQPLSKLNNLITLDLNGNNINNIEAIQSQKLNTLNIDSSKLTDISPLIKFTSLENLNIGFCPIENMDILNKLTKVEYIHGYNIDDLQKIIETSKKAKDIISNIIKPGMSEYERELAIHDYVAKYVNYDYEILKKVIIGDTDDAFHAYSALVKNISVCQGYAEATHLLLNLVGLNNILVLGLATDNNGASWDGHAWNIVSIEGEYFNLDTTWDHNEGSFYHLYFNITDDILSETHRWIESDYPKCISNQYNYDTQEYMKKNNITTYEPIILKGTINLPKDMVAPKGGLHCDIIVLIGNGDQNNGNVVSIIKKVIIPENSESVDFSLELFKSNNNYNLSYKVDEIEGLVPRGYYNGQFFGGLSSHGISIKADDFLKPVEINIQKSIVFKGIVKLPNNETAPINGLAVNIVLAVAKDNLQDMYERGISVRIPEGKNSCSYTLNVVPEGTQYLMLYSITNSPNSDFILNATYNGTNFTPSIDSWFKTINAVNIIDFSLLK